MWRRQRRYTHTWPLLGTAPATAARTARMARCIKPVKSLAIGRYSVWKLRLESALASCCAPALALLGSSRTVLCLAPMGPSRSISGCLLAPPHLCSPLFHECSTPRSPRLHLIAVTGRSRCMRGPSRWCRTRTTEATLRHPSPTGMHSGAAPSTACLVSSGVEQLIAGQPVSGANPLPDSLFLPARKSTAYARMFTQPQGAKSRPSSTR